MEPYTQAEIQAAYKELPRHQHGKIILHDLEAEFYNIHTFSPSGNGDRDTALFLEGCRWVVGYIKSCIQFEDPAEQDNPNGRNTYL